jgi:8-oxo-dGTP pyrophosphatase MutT (NUDIX family)
MDILPLLDELQTIARTGLNFTESPYDRERYERLLQLATEYYGLALDLPPADARARLSQELGYITPKVGAEAAIFDDLGRILLAQRSDDQRWCLPCGWVDPNETPAQAAVRETREEVGLEVRIVRLVDVLTRLPSAEMGPHTVVSVIYLCEITGGEIALSHECLDARYWRIEDVSAWHELHQRYAEAARDGRLQRR